jgi:prepilin-type N-terminal cleavage/methylation domain-containing protein
VVMLRRHSMGQALRAQRQRRRRGMTLLEVVFAMALLAVVAASAAGAFGFATASQLRERQRLAAAEVAHRLVLAYLDDPSDMPDSTRPLEYGPPEAPARFRWEYSELPVFLTEIAGDRRDSTRQSPLSMDRFRIVTVRVWLSEESGGTRYGDGNTPGARLSRMVDPVFGAIARNPDSAMNMIGSERAQRRWMQELMGNNAPVRGGAGVPGRGDQPGTGGAMPAPRERLGRTPPMRGSARDAFQRGPSGRGGERVPAGEVGMHMSRRGSSFDAADFIGDARREGQRR